MKRRPFLKIVGSVAGAFGLQSPLVNALGFKDRSEDTCEIPLRELGTTGEKLPLVVFPGLCLMHLEQEQCTESMHSAFGRGLNFYDVAPAYGRDGECEKKMGVALQDLQRDKYFLACKTKMRDKEGAREELERSLKRLKTDYFDLYQMHHLRSTEEVEEAFAPGGAMETIFKAQEEGLVRYIGFSAHTTKSAVAALEKHKFDSVMFPINFVEYYKFGFGKEVLEAAEKQGSAVLAMKTFSKGRWPQDVEKTRNWWYRPTEEQSEVQMAINFSASQKNVTAVVPPAWVDIFEKAVVAAKTYKPANEKELAHLQEMSDDCISVFEKMQSQFSLGDDSPYEGPPCMRHFA